ncbi:MAG: hypothetical protein R6U61_04625 [Thermoplasmata archaeon]
MSDINVKIPRKILDEFPEVKWSEVAEKAVMDEYKRRISIKVLDELLAESKLSDKDIDKLSDKVDQQVRKRIQKDIFS